jgi:hypothetical protein
MIDDGHYKQIAYELYEALKKEADRYLPTDRLFTKTHDVLRKYEELTTRRSGRTTALYMKAITEALENPGESVEFKDHYPHNWNAAKQHEDALKSILHKLNLNIIVQTKGQAQVFLCNKFGL